MHLRRFVATVCFLVAILLVQASEAATAKKSVVAFSELSFVEASARAAKDGKFVFIDFYTTWCAPCKKLDAETWTDDAVGALVNRHAIALKLDAEKEGRELAERYGVNAYPTLLLLKADGTEQDRIIGFRPATEFAAEFAAGVAGENGLKRARQAAEADAMRNVEEQVKSRYKLARELAQRGMHQEALEEYLWLYDEGMKKVPSYGGVRLSFVTGDMSQLAKQHPPAAAALRERRDAAKQKFDGKVADREAGLEFAALCDALGENEQVMAAFEALPPEDTRRQALGARLYAALVEARRYRDAYTARPFDAIVRQLEVTSQVPQSIPSEQRALMRQHTVRRAALDLEVLAGVEELEHARALQEKILAVDDTPATRELLRTHLVRAGQAGLIERADADRTAR